MIKRIVLTGGPCGGKTTAIKEVRNYFEKEGFIVLNVDETATELINMGIKPFGDDSVSMYNFQEYVFSSQLTDENLIERYIEDNKNKNIIALYDRCLLDNKSYVNDEEFNKLLNKFNIDIDEYMNKFDLVIHMVSAAIGTEEYTLLNNNARIESKEEAIKKDNMILNCYKNVKNHIIVDNRSNFENKVNYVIDIIKNII